MFPVASNETDRLAALRGLGILDTQPEAHFDAVCRLARDLFSVPIALVSFIDEDRQWFKAKCGMSADGTSREIAFCNYTILSDDVFVVEDAALDRRFADNPLAHGEHSIRFYAGAPLTLASGFRVGALCIKDTCPRTFSMEHVRQLRDLAGIVVAHLRLHETQQARGRELHDIHQTERALRESTTRYQTLAEHGADMVVHRSVDGTRTYVSSASQDILGFTPDEMRTLTLGRMVHSDELADVTMLLDDLQNGRADRGSTTHRHRHKDGRWVWVEARARLVRDETGLPREVITAVRDVSEHVAAVEAARASEARYRALADVLPQMVWVASANDGEASYVNQQFDRYHGPIGTSAAARLTHNHPGDADRMEQAWQACRDGRAVETEVRLRRHDGAYRWHKLMMHPIRRDGSIVEWLGTALDIDDIVTAHTKLEATTDLLRLAQESAGAGVWEWDVEGAVVRLSADNARMHGFDADPGSDPDARIEITLAQCDACVHPEDLPSVHAAVRRAIEEGTTYTSEYRVVGTGEPSGSYRWLQSFGRVLFGRESGRPARLVGLNLDVTERKEAEAALHANKARLVASEERLSLALDSGSDGLWDWNVATGAISVSGRYLLTLGYVEEELERTISLWSRLVHPDDAEHALQLMTEHLKGTSPFYECEYRMRTKEGAYHWALARGKVVARDGAGRALRVVGTYIDITRRKEAEQQIAHMAVHDALTGLPNRVLFWDRLQHALRGAQRYGGSVAVLACDLDRFKAINDTFGHPAGDALLRVVAQRLRSVVGDGNTVARLGGDEFAIILSRLDGPQAASITAQRVIDTIGKPLDLEGRFTTVGVSVGIALGPQDGDDADTLFKNADIALYRAKGAGRNTHSYYEPGLDAEVASRNLLENDLRDAVRRSGFVLHYQPILDVAGGTTSGFEALMRWHHPTRGPISPAEFIPLAEETGLIVSLGAWALREACREAAGWPRHLRVAVNVSAVQFQQPGFELAVVAALAASGLAPHRLELEITESVLLKDAEAAIDCLHRLRAAGVRVALDDFGTGYSSLSYLRRFPFDKIKIDRSFIREIGDPDAAAIVRAIIAIGVQLKMTITAEGVETQEQLDRVRQEGCTEVQGFFYSRPLTALDASAFVKSSKQLAVA